MMDATSNATFLMTIAGTVAIDATSFSFPAALPDFAHARVFRKGSFAQRRCAIVAFGQDHRLA